MQQNSQFPEIERLGNMNERAGNRRCVIAAAITILAVVGSGFLDRFFPGHHFVSRAGAIVSWLGGYIAYIGAGGTIRTHGDGDVLIDLDFASRLSKIGLIVLALGTVDWAYADLWW